LLLPRNRMAKSPGPHYASAGQQENQMNQTTKWIIALCSCAFVGCQSPNKPPVHAPAAEVAAPDTVGVEAAKAQFLAAWTKKPGETFTTDKLSQVVDTSDSGAFLSFDGMSAGSTVLDSWTKYQGVWGPGINQFTEASLTEMKSLRVWVSTDLAVTSSLVQISGKLPDGSLVNPVGHLTLSFRRVDGKWKVVHEHMSMPVRQ
jgi:hypothetical protein